MTVFKSKRIFSDGNASVVNKNKIAPLIFNISIFL